ncbi:MAG: permease-like cell division protein FtsX [Patescibacteria group bacterium]
MNALTSALANIRRSPYQALAATMIAFVTFSVIFCLSFFLYGAHLVLDYYEGRPQVIAFFEIEAAEEDVAQAQATMQDKPYVADITLTTKEDALAIYSEQYRESPMLLELVTADILPISLEVSATELAALALIRDDLAELPGVEDVVFQDSIINQVSTWINTGRIIGGASALVLTTLSFLVILVIIGMRVGMYKHRITIMRLLGATRWYVKRPFMMEGILYSSVGALGGWIVSVGILLYFSPDIQAFISEVQIFPLSWELLGLQLAIGLALSTLLGGFAGWTAASRLIRQ